MNAPALVYQRERNIHQRLAAVMGVVSYIKKDKQVDNYTAVTHDNVTAAVRPHFLTAGIIIEPTMMQQQTVDTGRRTAKNNAIIRFEAVYKVAFVNVDDPKDRVELLVAAHADDQGDKAPGKALSYAVKYAILKVLMIETGDDEEGRVSADDYELTDEEEALVLILREAADEGEERLQRAYNGLSDKARIRLIGQMPALKARAKEVSRAKP